MKRELRIAISVGDERGFFVPTIMAALMKAGRTPVVIISAFPQQPHRRARRLAADTFRRAKTLLQEPKTGAREELATFARTHDLQAYGPFDHVGEFAARHDIPVVHVSDVNSPEAASAVREYEVDILFNGGGGIFRKAIIAAPKLGIVNTHLGPLPHYRGYNVSEWSLFNHDEPGVTAHYIDAGLDTGDILYFQARPPKPPTDIAGYRLGFVTQKIEVLLTVIKGLEDGSIVGRPQRRDEGRQYYAMHPRLKAWVNRGLQG